MDNINGIVEQQAELEADAKRYRYLRERYERSGLWPSPYWVQSGESADAVIDKAIERGRRLGRPVALLPMELTSMTGYYSLIQYCPDATRLEVVNVGLAVFRPDTRCLVARVSDDNSRVRRFFGERDWENFDSFKLGIVERLESSLTF